MVIDVGIQEGENRAVDAVEADWSEPKRHPQNALTAARVKALRAPGRYADGGGLYCEVEPTGSKRWTLRIMVMGRRRDIGLGSTSLVPLAEARAKALAMRKIARDGGDPLAVRRQQKGIPTFADAARKVHADRQHGWKNEKHRGQFLTTLETYAFPVLGLLKVNDIETRHVLDALSPIWMEKQETARRVRQRIRTVLDWATAAGYRQGVNPVEGVNKGLAAQNGKVQHHTALPAAGVPAFILKLQDTQSSLPVKLALEFLILTVVRSGNVRMATWDEFDIDNALWTIPEEKMKGGRIHRVPLTPRCLAILADARELTGGKGYVFPGRNRRKPMSEMTLRTVIHRMKMDVVPHGFRSTFRDWAAEHTHFPREIAEAALAHVTGDQTERAYARTDHLVKRRELMLEWERHCCSSAGNDQAAA